MRGRWLILLVGLLLALLRLPGIAQEQDARTLLLASLKAMGGENMRSIQYSGSAGYVANPGQNYNPAMDWPANQIVSYTRTIDYQGKAGRVDYTLRTGTGQGGPAGGGNAPVVTTPLVGDQRTIQMVSGNSAWNLNGTTVVPAPADAEQRQLELWLTPHGCLKAALEPGTNPIVITRNEQGKGRIRAVSFMALGKYRVQCAINDKNLVERIQTYFPNPVVGDLYYELVLTNYKDFNGVMFPTTFHAHHDLDDDLEGEGVNVSGGHNSFGLTVTSVQANPADAVLTVPDAARTATIPPVRVESTKTADGFWYIGGGTHSSMAVEFRDFITVIEAPLNEERSLAVIAEVKKLIPNKPIRYLVSTHHHWDHLGGVRAYVAQEGVTIVLQQNNHSYYAEVLTVKPWVLKPDRLALAPPEEVAEGYTFESVGQKFVLTDGTKVRELYNVQGLAHAQGMLIAYLPKEKIVVEADLFTPPAPNAAMPTMVTASHRSFYNNVQRLKLDVTTIAPIHGGRTFPWAEFAKFVTAGKPATN
jgi:glyoxylase-like metal-dependent hydrolase (beta-lactamase superfamily II)